MAAALVILFRPGLRPQCSALVFHLSWGVHQPSLGHSSFMLVLQLSVLHHGCCRNSSGPLHCSLLCRTAQPFKQPTKACIILHKLGLSCLLWLSTLSTLLAAMTHFVSMFYYTVVTITQVHHAQLGRGACHMSVCYLPLGCRAARHVARVLATKPPVRAS